MYSSTLHNFSSCYSVITTAGKPTTDMLCLRSFLQVAHALKNAKNGMEGVFHQLSEQMDPYSGLLGHNRHDSGQSL